MATLTVGAGKAYTTIGAAVAAAQAGDTIMINAGTYTAQDLALTKNLTIESAGNGAVVVTDSGYVTKGLFIAGTSGNTPDITIEGLTFKAAKATAGNGGNGAGIRYQNGNLTLINDTFMNNQEGILATPFTADTGTIIVQGSTFNHNGAANGQEHNIYIGHIADFSINDSLVENAVVGHEIKTRAFNSEITNNVIMDGPTGTSSYAIDVPNGGNAIIQGNTIEQGPKSENPWTIAYGEEGALQPGSLTVAGNVILNDLSGGDGIWNDTSISAMITGNETYGLTSAKFLKGPATVMNDTTLAVEPKLTAAIPANGPTMAFLGGSTGSAVVYASDLDEIMPAPTSVAGINYEVALGGTGTLTISDFRVGTDSLQLAQGVSITSEAVSGGALNISLSNSAEVILPGAG